MMKRQLAIGVTTALLSVGLMGQTKAGRIHTLDLTRPDVVRTGPRVGSGEVIGIRPRPLPLELRLNALDKAEYFFENPVTFDVSVTNIGATPIQFPWSADGAAFEHLPRRTEARIRLQVTDRDGRVRLISVIGLNGSPDIPGSFQTLLPGETASIRASGPAYVDPDMAGPMDSAGPVPVRAALTLVARTQPPTAAWETVLSLNTIPTSFRLRRDP